MVFCFMLHDNQTNEEISFAANNGNHQEPLDNHSDVEFVGWWFEEPFEILPKSTTIEQLMVKIGAFPSLGQARKAGFTGKVPAGFNKLGTKKNPVWVANIII